MLLLLVKTNWKVLASKQPRSTVNNIRHLYGWTNYMLAEFQSHDAVCSAFVNYFSAWKFELR
jgi:hypothetical protein